MAQPRHQRLPAPRRAGLVASALVAVLLASGMARGATPGNALVMAWNIDAISTFDPAQIAEVVTNEIFSNTCDSLAAFDPADEKKVIPALAESWDVSPDGLKITFHLRDRLRFPSGEAATARDLAWSMQRVVRLGFGNAATLTDYGFTKENVEQMITAPDDRTLVMKLDKPYPIGLILQAVAANRVTALLDRKTIMAHEANGDLGNKYLATHTECVGPYRLRQWNSGDVVVLEANRDYWGPAPKLPRVIIRHVAEAGTQRLLLEKGDVDIARNLTPEDLRTLEDAKGITLARTRRPTMFYWGFNSADPIFASEKVRLAMRYLVDYDALQKTVMAYDGVARASFVPLGSFGALDEKEGQPFKLDTSRAKQLLAEAGYPDGFEASVIIGSSPYAAPIAQHIQANAAKVGVRLRLEQMANAQLFARHRGREFQSAMLGWGAGMPDAHANASRLIYNPDNRLEAKLTQFPSWRAAFMDEAANKVVEDAVMERDESRRAAMYEQLQRDMMQRGPAVFLFQTIYVAGVRDTVRDWTWNGFQTYYDRAAKN
ncbi:ABC transporter substrate-binding protein [Roseomonas marmotae]|uniref:ABC transporter substrate-binding protein n=1 Tax=Roseomonas marmotae TaxID=2768161 RepID=A0ABS3KEY4_9PROT|nr:ABC transporter substrate-binding protein [Roseomonas marmotae]MBO1076033.1 ABC transporter substrate-binding protein [Roseomonas marmotae]QTI80163.1 ABC transporter substrate-binding protein [Roseomonas marmotae]